MRTAAAIAILVVGAFVCWFLSRLDDALYREHGDAYRSRHTVATGLDVVQVFVTLATLVVAVAVGSGS